MAGLPVSWWTLMLALAALFLVTGLPFEVDGAMAQNPPPKDSLSREAAETQRIDDRERAVRLAREGQYEEALGILRRLHEEAPADFGVRGDLAAVLSWAGMDEEALEVGVRLPFWELDPVIAESVARSARNEGRPGVAAGIYHQVLSAHPERAELQVGLALAYLEWNKLAEAQLRAAVLVDRFSDHPSAQVAAGHVFREAGRTDDALRSYRAALVARPDDFEIHRAAFDLLANDGKFDEADGLMQEFVERHPDHLPARVLRATGFALAGDLGRAQDELEELKAENADDLAVRQELGAVYRWRGWPRRALAEYEAILQVDPVHETAHVGRTAALMDMDRRSEARTALDTLRALRPEAEDPHGMDRRFHLQGLWEMAVDAGRGSSTGGELGTRDHTLTTRLVSPPIADRLRFRLASHREDARFEEGTGVHDRISAGVELSARDLRLMVEGTASRESVRNPGVTARLDLDAGDRASLRLAGASHSVQVPLRAEPTGVRGWDAQVGFGWRAHEGRSWRVQGGVVEMTDDNRRLDAYGVLEQTLFQRSGGGLGLMLEGYGATNRRDDVPYFSPDHLVTAGASLAWRWTPWQEGDARLRQELVLSGGAVAQADEDTLPVGALRVDHDWAMGPQLSFRYGGRWGSPVYDGDRERRLSVHLGFTWRLP